MVSGFFGWHVLVILSVLAISALVIWGVYWVARLGARRGVLDREGERRDP